MQPQFEEFLSLGRFIFNAYENINRDSLYAEGNNEKKLIQKFIKKQWSYDFNFILIKNLIA